MTYTKSETTGVSDNWDCCDYQETNWEWVGKYLKLLFEDKITVKELTPKVVAFLNSQEMYHREKQRKMGNKILELNKKLKENKTRN